jgi:hypothetical protein
VNDGKKICVESLRTRGLFFMVNAVYPFDILALLQRFVYGVNNIKILKAINK